MSEFRNAYIAAKSEEQTLDRYYEYCESNDRTADELIECYKHYPTHQIRRNKTGYIYVLQYPTGESKIGMTSNPKSRLQNYRSSCPYDIEFCVLFSTDKVHELEKSLLSKYHDKLIRNDWFNLTTEDITYIQGLST